MAEYVEVMKQKKRMCNSTLCCKCDIFHFSGENVGNCPQFISNNPSKAEKIIMAWAAEHPEPVYPTWGEWLVEIGAAKRVPIGDPWPVEMADGSMIGPEYETVLAQNERIPADIAEKLGIEPKEGA